MMTEESLPEVIERFRQGDRTALNRLVTLVARGEELASIRAALGEARADARIIAFTGNSGVGKSTLIGRLVELIRSREKRVAVLACDPESSLTGGALLGDRVRMTKQTDDPGVWIRSLAATSGRQAVSEHLELIAALLQEFGFDYVLLETVGAGQGDVAVRRIADVIALLVQTEIGDELQWEKAGILEVADVVVVHKGDLPGAERTESQVRDLLNLPGCRTIPVLRVSSKQNQGLSELWERLESHASQKQSTEEDARSLLLAAQARLAQQFDQHPEFIRSVLNRLQTNQLDEKAAVEELLRSLISS